MNDKYELTDETCVFEGVTLHRIKALKDFSDIEKGDLGGFIESTDNLSQMGYCWVYDNAKVTGQASVINNAKVMDNAEVTDRAKIVGDARIMNSAKVMGNAIIMGYAIIMDNAIITDNVMIADRAAVRDNAKIKNFAIIRDRVYVDDNITVENNVVLRGVYTLKGDAIITDIKDFIVFKNWWSSGRFFVWTRSNNMWSAGCFYGTGKELIEKAYKNSETSGKNYERIVKFVESFKDEKIEIDYYDDQNI